MFESHTGNVKPEIWIGRLTASTLISGNEIDLINYIKSIWEQVYNNYNFNTELELSKQELLNIEPLPQDIIMIEQMKKLMAQKQNKIIPLLPIPVLNIFKMLN